MTARKPIIGVFALQGAVELHKPHIEAAGAEFRTVKTAKQFAEVDGFILPGGESTTMLKLINIFNLWDVLADEFSKKPVWGICAGSILMASTVKNPEQASFATLPITIERNGYGRQLDSHFSKIKDYEVSFIRAPVITETGDCEIIASHQGQAVWVQKGNQMATTFHPEINLEPPSPMHVHFTHLVKQSIS